LVGGFNNNTSQKILNDLDTVCLRFSKVELEEVAVIDFRVNSGGGDGTSCFEIKIWTNTTELTNVRITRFRQCRVCRGATLHQKMVVTGVGDIWRTCGAPAYNGGLGAEPPGGSRGRAPGGG